MSPVQRRFRNVINRVGEAFTVSGNARQGIFSILSPYAAEQYIDATTLAAVGRPMRAVYVPFDDVTATGNSVSYAGLTLTVEQALDLRHQGEAVARLLILA